MTEQQGSGLPLGGIGLTVGSYAEFLAKEYLGDYVRSGGAAVRFVVPGNDEVAARWHAALAAAAEDEGYLYTAVDAAHTKVHMVDQIYAALAGAVDWQQLARLAVQTVWDSVDLPAPPGEGGPDLRVSAVAAFHDMDAREAGRTVRRRLECDVLHDVTLAREFRLAMLRLCQAELGTSEVSEQEHAAVLAWLRVEPVGLRSLRSVGLFGRLGRHNARSMLLSLAAWRARPAGQGALRGPQSGRRRCPRQRPVRYRGPLPRAARGTRTGAARRVQGAPARRWLRRRQEPRAGAPCTPCARAGPRRQPGGHQQGDPVARPGQGVAGGGGVRSAAQRRAGGGRRGGGGAGAGQPRLCRPYALGRGHRPGRRAVRPHLAPPAKGAGR